MKRRFTILTAALALLVSLAFPMGMRGQTTVSYGWETTDDADPWTISDAIVATQGEGNTGTYAGKINTNSTTVQFNEKVYVTSFSYAFKRTSNNNNYSVYIETSTDGSTWSIKDTQAMNTFTNGSYRTVTKEFDGTQELYVRFRCNNTTAVRYVDDVTITYATSAAQLDPCDLTLTNASTSLVFDLYNNSDAQVINYTTSSTGEVTVADSDYITAVVDQTNKTITVTPVAVTNGAKVITVNQAADDNYAAGSKTFTINITDSTPFTGGDVTFNPSVDKDLENTSQGEGSITKLGVTFACNNGILGNGTEYRMYKNSVTTFSVSDGTITQIAFTGTSSNPASGFATQTGWTTDGNNGTWTGSAQEVSFTASGAQVRATLIVVTVDMGGAPAPSITVTNPDEIAYDATSGSFNFTVNNPVEGANLSATDNVDWIDEVAINNGANGYSVTFATTANEAGTSREGVITLTYAYGDNQTVTKDVTVTQAGNPNVTMTIAEVREQGTGNVVTIGTVTSFSVNNNNTTAYIQDASAAIVVYGNFTTAVGDEIRVSGTLSTYHGLLEITNPEVTVISQGNTVNPEVMTVAEAVASTNQGWYIRIEDATVTEIEGQNTTIAQGENTIVVRGISGVEYVVNDVLSLNGNIGCYDGNQIANPQNVEVQAAPAVPSITFNPDVVNLDAAQQTIQIPFTYENIVVTNYQSFTIHYYDANGEVIQLPESPWYVLGVTGSNDEGYNLTGLVTANEGEARSAYMKVSALDAEETVVYSNLVTINQAQYVVDYATLPFAYDGNGTGELPNGFTVSGLGTYNSSPAMKFDGTGDYAILKFNERPGTLTFDIKGNTFSGGTFTVQTSEDGETYTDLKTYTELGDTQHESFDNLGENVRYIKWIYTEKVSGNVALGNIALAEYVAPVLVASITVNPDEVELDAEEHDGTLDLTYENLTITDMTDFDIQFCDANGDELSEEPDWIEVLVAEQDPTIGEGYVVSYYMVENEGPDARTAYFKVYAMDDETNLVYSNLVTISQEGVEVPPTPGEWVMVGLNDLTEDDVFVIVGVYDEDESSFAMPNSYGTGNAPSAVDVTMVGNTLAGDIAENLKWNLSIGEDGYTFYPNGETESWLYCNNTNNGVRVGTNENNVFTMTPEGYLYNNATSRYVGIYNRQDWRCYNSINSNIKNQTFAFYKRVDEGSLVTYTLDIEGYQDDNNNGGYYLIASPVSMVRPTFENGFLTEAYDLYYFDQAQENEWRNYKQNHFNIAACKGYLYASKENTTLTFTGVPYQGNGEIELSYTEGGDFPGWNLVGNPYDRDVYIDRDFFVMKSDGSEIIAGENNTIAQYQGFFVIAEEDGEILRIGDDNNGNPGSKIVLNVSNARNSVIDRALIRFGEGRTLPKFMFNPNSTKLYINQNGKDFAVVRSINENSTPVSFHAAENGTYTLSVNAENVEMEYLHLLDNMTGADVDLLATPSYSFEATTNDNAARFTLVFASLTGIEENSDNFAFFSNGSFVINNEGNATVEVIDVTGRIISSETINGCANVNVNAANGVYMLRLINGENVKVQKVVVR